MLRIVASFALGKDISLKIARGSVLDFVAIPDKNDTSYKPVGAIVNAANEGCLGGGGVDGAIGDAGGESLFLDRKALPIIPESGGIRCETGDAVITGPGDYGKLRVPYVIHAVGPAYFSFEEMMEHQNDFRIPNGLLRSAYQQTLERCKENDITDVGFSLLSAGIFRGRQSMKNVLAIGVAGIRDWVEDTEDCGALKTITLCGFSEREAAMLMYEEDAAEEKSANGDDKHGEKRPRSPDDAQGASVIEDDDAKPAAEESQGPSVIEDEEERKHAAEKDASEADVVSAEAKPMDVDDENSEDVKVPLAEENADAVVDEEPSGPTESTTPSEEGSSVPEEKDTKNQEEL
ncbi:MAG: hypothetical protein SGARI_004301 [Bacillariaceae sp.]